MATARCFGAYNASAEAWENYEIRLTAWLELQDITQDDKKRAALISEIGPDTFAVLKDLAFPEEVSRKTFNQLLELLRSHFKKSRTPMADRLLLHNRKQGEKETLTEFIAALKKIASTCDYGAELENRLRDAFLFGVKNQKILNRLIEESQKDNFTWVSATRLALAMETVACGVTQVDQRKVLEEKSGEVNRVRYRGRTRGRYRGRSRGYHGRGRGYHSQSGSQNSGSQSDHKRSDGNRDNSAKSSQQGHSYTYSSGSYHGQSGACYHCGQEGHFKRNCPQLRGRQRGRGQVRYLNDDYQYQNNFETHENRNTNYMENVEENLCDQFQKLLRVTGSEARVGRVVNMPPEYTEMLSINNVPLEFTIDTACPVSIINVKCYERNFAHIELDSSSLRLSSYSKHAVPVKGVFNAQVKYGKKQFQLPLYVTEGDDACLLGRQWLEVIRLDWNQIFSVKQQPRDLQELLREYADVFKDDQGLIQGFKADIKVTEGASPIFWKPRPVPYALKENVEKELDKLEKRGVLSKIDRSEWAAPIVVVPKSDGTIRLCGDYKVTVNKVIQNESYPLPTAEDLFATLSGGEVFSKIDLSAAYQQLELTQDAKQYLVINTSKGLYQYNRLSFGVSTAPSVFQKTMDQVLQGLEGVVCYLDDILISSTKEKHVDRVAMVLERLRKFGIKAKRAKCSFMVPSVTYLGHDISSQGVKPTTEKVKAINDLKAPSDLQELRVLLGLVNYYAKFLPNQSTLLAPWYRLLRKETKFIWSKECATALEKVKKLLTSDTLLVHFDPTKEIVLACDASPVGLGCVLSHVINGEERPIAYGSRSLSAAERNYCQLEREGLAVIYGLMKFHKYIYGRKITIVTDNKPITKILGPKVGIPSLAASRLQRWAMILMGHDYELRYKSGKEHGNCDGLSRLPGSSDHFIGQELSVNYFSYVDQLPVSAKQIAEASRKDPVLSKVMTYVMSGWPAHCADEDLKPYFSRRDQLSCDQGCLMWGMRVIIPPCFRQRLLDELHMTHSGIVKMKSLSRSYLWFPGLDSAIEDLVNACGPCQALQKESPKVPLIPWEYPRNVWERVHIDFFELDKKFYFLLVDSHSKWLEIIEMKNTTAQSTVRELRKLFALYGLPKVVVSDNGPQLTSAEMERFLRQNGVKHSLSPPYH